MEEIAKLQAFRDRVDQLAKEQGEEKDASARMEELQKHLADLEAQKARAEALLAQQKQLREKTNELGVQAAADATKPLADKGAKVCDSPAEAAKGAEFVCSIVSDDVATRQVMLGDKGVVEAAAPGTIILDSSTNTPAMAREVAFAARAKGIFYLDAPVSGSLAQAQGKELVFIVGGDKAAFDKAQPVLSAMGRMVRRIGDSGAGATLVGDPMVTMNPASRYGDDATGFLSGSELENPDRDRTDD